MNLFFRKTIHLEKISPKQESIIALSMKPLPSMSFINSAFFNQHPSILEAEKIFKSY